MTSAILCAVYIFQILTRLIVHLWKLIISLSGLSIWLESKFVYFEKILNNNIVNYVYYGESYYKVFFKI